MLLLQLLMLQLKLWAMKIPKQGKPFALVNENLRLRHSLQTMSNRCKDEFDIVHMLFFLPLLVLSFYKICMICLQRSQSWQ